MPVVRCNICERRQRIPTKKWKLILSDEPYVCSRGCVRKWIGERRGEIWVDELHKFGIKNSSGGFRSDFERRFAQFLTDFSFWWEYERWAFPIKGSFYIPDFHLLDTQAFIETKGLWRMGQKKKFRAFRKQYPDIPILVIPWLIYNQF